MIKNNGEKERLIDQVKEDIDFILHLELNVPNWREISLNYLAEMYEIYKEVEIEKASSYISEEAENIIQLYEEFIFSVKEELEKLKVDEKTKLNLFKGVTKEKLEKIFKKNKN
jgi:hypothetical protein